MALTKEDVVSVNIVDLGLIYDVDVREAAAAEPGYDVSVKMTLTSPGCPMSQSISAEVHRKLLVLDRVRHAQVDLVWEPVWHPSMITAEGRHQLNPN